jgi:hypothetical protein
MLWPSALVGGLIVSASVLAALGGVYLVRRKFSYEMLRENNDFVGYVYAIVGLIYGIFLAFTVFQVSAQFSQAEISATSEATYLSELWRDAQVFPHTTRNLIQDRLIAYAQAVVATEWDTMARHATSSSEATAAYEVIWESYYGYEPQTPQQREFYTQSLRELNEFGRQRRQRILYSGAQLPSAIWVFLVGGAMLTVSVSYLIGARHAWAQALVTGMLSALIGFGLFLVLFLQRPFTGRLSHSSSHSKVGRLSSSNESKIRALIRPGQCQHPSRKLSPRLLWCASTAIGPSLNHRPVDHSILGPILVTGSHPGPRAILTPQPNTVAQPKPQ